MDRWGQGPRQWTQVYKPPLLDDPNLEELGEDTPEDRERMREIHEEYRRRALDPHRQVFY